MLWRSVTRYVFPKIDGRFTRELDALGELLLDEYPIDTALWAFRATDSNQASAERYLWFEAFLSIGLQEGLITKQFFNRVLIEARSRLRGLAYEAATDATNRLKARCQYAVERREHETDRLRNPCSTASAGGRRGHE